MSVNKVMTEQPHQLLVLVHLQSREAVAQEAFGPQILTEMMAVVGAVAVTPMAAVSVQAVQELQDKEMTEATVIPTLPITVEAAVAVLVL